VCDAPCTLTMGCGHACAAKCGQPCSDVAGTCPACIVAFEERRRAQLAQAAALQASAVALGEANARRAAEAAALAGSVPQRTELTEAGCAHEYLRVRDSVLQSVLPEHKFGIEVTRIEKVHAPALEAAFWETLRTGTLHVSHPPRSELFHGTRADTVKSILEHGFQVARKRKGGASHQMNMLGAAVYLAPHASKAAQVQYTGAGECGGCVLLVCDALLGSVKQVDAADYTLDDADRRRTDKYDSAYCKRNTNVVFDEYAVYNPTCVLPRYVVHFTRVDRSINSPMLQLADTPVPPTRRSGQVRWFEITGAQFRDPEFPAALKQHFSIAYAAFNLLMKSGSKSERAPEVIKVTLCVNPDLESRFLKAKEALQAAGISVAEHTVFHGTSGSLLDTIQETGLRVGGVHPGIPVVFGVKYGSGVYTGLAASVSMDYVRDVKSMLVCQAMQGLTAPCGFAVEQCGDKCWRDNPAKRFQSFLVKDFALILASGDLVLPRYQVEWE
jgi:hypothetical protein